MEIHIYALALFSGVSIFFLTLHVILRKCGRISGSAQVNCWFCNQDNTVTFAEKNSFVCAACDQYNGFTADGDYNRDIPQQYDEKFNQRSTRYCDQPRDSRASILTPSPLCVECKHNQSRIIQQLSAFEPTNEQHFDKEYRALVKHLDVVYKLCPRCEAAVDGTLKDLHGKLKLQWVSDRLSSSRQERLTIKAERPLVRSLRFWLWLLLAFVLGLCTFIYYHEDSNLIYCAPDVPWQSFAALRCAVSQFQIPILLCLSLFNRTVAVLCTKKKRRVWWLHFSWLAMIAGLGSRMIAAFITSESRYLFSSYLLASISHILGVRYLRHKRQPPPFRSPVRHSVASSNTTVPQQPFFSELEHQQSLPSRTEYTSPVDISPAKFVHGGQALAQPTFDFSATVGSNPIIAPAIPPAKITPHFDSLSFSPSTSQSFFSQPGLRGRNGVTGSPPSNRSNGNPFAQSDILTRAQPELRRPIAEASSSLDMGGLGLAVQGPTILAPASFTAPNDAAANLERMFSKVTVSNDSSPFSGLPRLVPHNIGLGVSRVSLFLSGKTGPGLLLLCAVAVRVYFLSKLTVSISLLCAFLSAFGAMLSLPASFRKPTSRKDRDMKRIRIGLASFMVFFAGILIMMSLVDFAKPDLADFPLSLQSVVSQVGEFVTQHRGELFLLGVGFLCFQLWRVYS